MGHAVIAMSIAETGPIVSALNLGLMVVLLLISLGVWKGKREDTSGEVTKHYAEFVAFKLAHESALRAMETYIDAEVEKVLAKLNGMPGKVEQLDRQINQDGIRKSIHELRNRMNEILEVRLDLARLSSEFQGLKERVNDMRDRRQGQRKNDGL